jgi:hypothetical protein
MFSRFLRTCLWNEMKQKQGKSASAESSLGWSHGNLIFPLFYPTFLHADDCSGLHIAQSDLISQKSTTKNCCNINLFLHLTGQIGGGTNASLQKGKHLKYRSFLRIHVSVTSTEICYCRMSTWQSITA